MPSHGGAEGGRTPGGPGSAFHRLHRAFSTGAFFALLGVPLALAGATSVLRCERGPGGSAPTCGVEWRVLLGRVPVWTPVLANLAGAWTESLETEGGANPSLVLLGEPGAALWLPPVTDPTGAEQAAARVRAFVEAPEAPAFEARFEPDGNAAVIGLFGDGLLVVALLCWLAIPWHLAGIARALEERLPG